MVLALFLSSLENSLRILYFYFHLTSYSSKDHLNFMLVPELTMLSEKQYSQTLTIFFGIPSI